MPKPTLLQHILNRPSQRYTDPRTPQRRSLDAPTQQSKYHSVRDDMRRAAASPSAEDSHKLKLTETAISSTSAAHAPTITRKAVGEDAEVEADSDEQEFFTPNVSPRQSYIDDGQTTPTSTASSGTMGAPLAAQPSLLASLIAQEDVTSLEPKNLVPPRPRMPHVRTTSSSSSSTHSVASTSTLDGSYAPSASDVSWPTSFSIPSNSTLVTSPATSDNGHARSTSSRSNSSSRRRREESKRLTYTDDDWAKDVRWLVPSAATATDKKTKTASSSTASPALSRSSSSASSASKRSRARTTFELDPTMLPIIPVEGAPIPIRARHRRSTSQSTSASHRSTARRRMSAVWEEDESEESSGNPAPRRVHTDPVPLSSLGRIRSLSTPQRPAHRSRPPPSLLSADSGTSWTSSTYTSASRTVDLPVPLPVSDGGNPSGFTSLVLPRAAYTPSNKRYSMRFGSESRIDITRSGLAQTTMSTVSITKNAASSALSSHTRFLSLSSLSLSSPSVEKKVKLVSTPSHLLASLPPPLSFTSHTPPPSKVNSHQILVQVYAVALDGLDASIVAEKAARNDCYGFVPGRAFVGRAVEVGFEVNNIVKSDWVIGLLDVRKCGALAEFVLIEKRRVTRCPRPSPALKLEQLALLSLSGVPAHRAVRTSGFDSDNGRALVLLGHDGIGALIVQELAAAGMHVTAHIPADAAPRVSSSSSSSVEEKEKDAMDREVDTREAEERVKKWGARAVRVGDAVEVIESCAEGSFDFVIDTIGGRRIWDASRRVLASSGLFTTLVGDAGAPSSTASTPTDSAAAAVPGVNAHFRANLRSIRRAFRTRKSVGYTWVSPAADVDHSGEDVRDSLVEVARRASEGELVPHVEFDRCLPFERTPELFARGVLGDGRTGVVKIVD